MPTYEYETIPQRPGEQPVRFEIYQPITAAPLTQHPETGVPVRRLISGGLGIVTESKTAAAAPPCGQGACGLGAACESGICAAPEGPCGGGSCGLDA
ncbi:MAG: zinc ribbon domain-containing protein [Planctomycetota bacterium]|nr:zinc ribbon domain-containing protein [Planctomycetota bacterium]MCX8039366.1 zinc ribbon domain-containing protein [Planctomycetota bacterium]MDW8373346.1 zinc ribbon domain-containing protein [Planctomycetota bacterium]